MNGKTEINKTGNQLIREKVACLGISTLTDWYKGKNKFNGQTIRPERSLSQRLKREKLLAVKNDSARVETSDN